MIIAVALHYGAYRQMKLALNLQAVSTLSSSVRQLDNMMEQLNMASLRLTSSSQFKELADSTADDLAQFTYTAYETQNSLRLILPQEQLMFDGTIYIYMENSNYIISANSLSDFDTAVKYRPGYSSLMESFSDGLLDPNLWRRFIPLQQEGQDYLYICPISNSLLSINSSIHNVLCFETTRDILASFFPM